jgi:hypothetical protein
MTVHDVQLRPAGTIPVTAHDFMVDPIVTPAQVLRPRRAAGKGRA